MDRNEHLTVALTAGYCPEWMVWRIIRDVAACITREGGIAVSPYSVVRTEDGSFAFDSDAAKSPEALSAADIYLPPEKTLSEAGSVWSLAATVFRLVMGCDVMSGSGGSGQTASSPVPYMRMSMPQLSELVCRCLDHNPAHRPQASEILKVAEERCTVFETMRESGSKRRTSTGGNDAKGRNGSASTWPEQMTALMAALILLFLPSVLSAQKSDDAELSFLIGTVSMLRISDGQARQHAYDLVKETLAADNQWTRMDELVDDCRGECRLTDRTMNWFRLNTILNSIEISRIGNDAVKGDFLNGEDPNFRYSLLEKSVRAQSSVRYRVKGREGVQTFVLVPYNQEAAMFLTLRLIKDNEIVAEGHLEDDGNIYMKFVGELHPDETITIEVRNSGVANCAMVLINHNTRK